MVMEHCRRLWSTAGGYGALQVVMEHCRWLWSTVGGYGAL